MCDGVSGIREITVDKLGLERLLFGVVVTPSPQQMKILGGNMEIDLSGNNIGKINFSTVELKLERPR